MFKIFKKIDKVHILILLGLCFVFLTSVALAPDGVSRFDSLFIGAEDDTAGNTIAVGGKQAFIKGTLEVDGVAYLDAAVELGSTLKFGDTTYTMPSTDGAGVLTSNGSGTVTWAAAGSATAWSSIVDPTGDTTITFADEEVTVLSFGDTDEPNFKLINTGNLANAAVLHVETSTGTPTDGRLVYGLATTEKVDGFHYYNSTADVGTQTYGLIIDYKDEGDAEADFILCRDASATDTVFSVSEDGNTVIEGTLGVTGACTFSGAVSYGALSLTGDLTMGSSGTSHDIIIYSDTSDDDWIFHDTEVTAYLTDYELQLDDGSILNFGGGSAIGTGDATMYHNGTSLFLMPATDDDDWYIGNSTTSWNVIWAGATASSLVTLDSTNDLMDLNGVDIRLQDSDQLRFGTGASIAGDFTLISTGDSLITLAAVAGNAGTTFTLGDATNHFDVSWLSGSASDLFLLDWDNTQMTLTDVNINIVESTDFGDGAAALLIECTDLGTAGGAAIMLDLDGMSSPNAGAMGIEIKADGKDIIGIYADVDSTGNCYNFLSSGVTGALDAVMLVSSDAAMAATSSVIEAAITGDASNAPNLFLGEGSGKNVTGLNIDCQADGSTANHIYLYSDGTAVGPMIYSLFEDADTPDAADAVFTLKMSGDDSGGTATEYARIEAESLLTTAGAEDGELIVSVAANDGTLTQALVVGPQVDSANTGISVGSGSGAAAITAEGVQSLILQTNYGTASPVLTIASGAAADVTWVMSTTGEFIIKNVDAGATGAELTLYVDNDSQATDDVVSRILTIGNDDSDDDEDYGRIDVVVNSPATAGPNSAMGFYVAVSGTLTEYLHIDETINGIQVGHGATSYVESKGSQNLVLQTGNSTTGTITIVDGSNGDITLAPNGSGQVLVNLADAAAITTQSYLTYVARFAFAEDTPDATDDIAIFSSNAPEMQIIDVWRELSALDDGITATLRTAIDGGGSAISTALSCDSTGIVRTTALTNEDIAANSSLYLNFSADPDTADGELFIMYIRESQ